MPTRLAKLNGFRALNSAFENLVSNFAIDTVWFVGSPVEYGLYLEMGTRNHPPYPWLGPAVDTVVSNEANRIVKESNTTEELIANVALAIEREAIQNTSGKDQRPFVQTGNLHGSIEAVPA